MPLQSSGAIGLSHGRTEFGSGFSNLSSYYAVAAGVPTSGTISLSNLYSKGASTPSISVISTSNVSTNSAAQNGSINLGAFVTDTYGAPFTYQSLSYSASHFSSASVSGASLSFNIPLNKFANTTSLSVVVQNRFGRTANISIPFKITGYNIGSSSLGSMSLTNNSGSRSLGSYFTDYSGAGLSYSITYNPYSSASISGTTLNVYGNYRNTSYSVTVQATNSFGQSSSASVSVTEAVAPPSASSMGSTSTLQTSSQAYYLYSYFSGTITSFSVTSNPYSSASISGSYLYVYPNNRNTSYYVTVTAYNSSGSASSSLLVYEGPPAPSASSMGSTSTLQTSSVSYYLYSYFSGSISSFSVTSNPYGSASISGGYLYIYPNNRNTSYYVTVTAYNSGGSVSSSLLVYEGTSVQAPTSSSMGNLTLYGTSMTTQTYTWYFSGTVTSYALTGNPYGNVTMDTGGGYLVIQANNRGTSYYVTVTAYNAGGSASSSLYVTEIVQVCANITGTYTAYSDNTFTNIIGYGNTVNMNRSTGSGTVNNGGGNQTMTYTSYYNFSVPSWGVTCTANASLTRLTWSNGTIWLKA
jgi:hypothetical protein